MNGEILGVLLKVAPSVIPAIKEVWDALPQKEKRSNSVVQTMLLAKVAQNLDELCKRTQIVEEGVTILLERTKPV